MPRHELNAERIMGEVQRALQSNENVNLQDGMQVHLVHVGMPQSGVASRKKTLWIQFVQVSRYQKERHADSK